MLRGFFGEGDQGWGLIFTLCIFSAIWILTLCINYQSKTSEKKLSDYLLSIPGYICPPKGTWQFGMCPSRPYYVHLCIYLYIDTRVKKCGLFCLFLLYINVLLCFSEAYFFPTCYMCHVLELFFWYSKHNFLSRHFSK